MSTLLRAGLLATCLAAALGAAPGPVRADPVTNQDLLKAQDNASEWLMYGRDYRNWRFSPLSEITPENAGQLKPTWAMSTGGTFGGLEATPLYRAGVLYFSADYGRIFAVDARTGNIIWHYEPKYDDNFSAMLCCGPIHRGVALKDDLLYAVRLDATLQAFNQADGKIVWTTKIDEWKNGVTTNSAPLIVGDHVIVGVSGGEYGVRGYLKSYNAKTGKLEWTTYTIPAPGEPGSETWPKDDSLEDRRRADLADRQLRRGYQHALLGRGQSGLLGRRAASRRQSVDRQHAGARSRHRQDQMGLPIHAQ